MNKDKMIIIEDIKICEYMELLDEITNFWHGQTNDLNYYKEFSEVYSILCRPSIDYLEHFFKKIDECLWKDSECQIYAEEIDINQWKKINWNSISQKFSKFDQLDILVNLFREQILIFYKMGYLENDINFKQIILNFIDNFNIYLKLYLKEGFEYLYYDGFCKIAFAMYTNDFYNAKNLFINFANDLNDKCKLIKNDKSNETLVKSLIKTISERRC